VLDADKMAKELEIQNYVCRGMGLLLPTVGTKAETGHVKTLNVICGGSLLPPML
jgi:hypothetical protein